MDKKRPHSQDKHATNEMFIRVAEHPAAVKCINDNADDVWRNLFWRRRWCFECYEVEPYIQKLFQNVNTREIEDERLREMFEEVLVHFITADVLLDTYRRSKQTNEAEEDETC